jgi:hypothetical protein
MLMATGSLVVRDLAQDLHAALNVCDSGAVVALHCLLIMSRNEFGRSKQLTSRHANRIEHIRHKSIACRPPSESGSTRLLIARL